MSFVDGRTFPLVALVKQRDRYAYEKLRLRPRRYYGATSFEYELNHLRNKTCRNFVVLADSYRTWDTRFNFLRSTSAWRKCSRVIIIAPPRKLDSQGSEEADNKFVITKDIKKAHTVCTSDDKV